MVERLKAAAVTWLKWAVAIGTLLAGAWAAILYHRANHARGAALARSAQLLREKEARLALRARTKHAEADLHLARAAETRAAGLARAERLREAEHENLAALVERWNGGPAGGLQHDTD